MREYGMYVKLVRDRIAEGMERSSAVDAAVDEAARSNLLGGFFRIHKSEVLDMSLTEFNEEEFIYNRRAEGREEGREEGIAIGAERKAIETARKLLSLSVSPDIVSQGTGLPLEQVVALR